MARQQIKVSRRILFTWFMLVGFIFLLAPQNLTNKFQLTFAHIFRWPLSIGRSISLSSRVQPELTDMVSRRKYNQLQNHLANVTEELNQEKEKVEKLSKMRDRRALEGAGLMIAYVITASSDGFIINRGEGDGLEKGQFVLADNSIIGTICEVSPRTARVELITETTSNIAVTIGGLKTVLQGDGKGAAKVRMFSIKHDVKIGDNVYACKKPGYLDTTMVVGTIAHCERDSENPLLWDVTVKPACDIQQLSDVAVIVMNPKRSAVNGR